VGVNKGAKYDKLHASAWGLPLLLNPSFDALSTTGGCTVVSAAVPVDPALAVTGSE
jgi:hypothetical protein